MTFSSAFVQAAHIPLWRLMNGKGVILDAPAVCAELQGMVYGKNSWESKQIWLVVQEPSSKI
jgi:hypothetical protein